MYCKIVIILLIFCEIALSYKVIDRKSDKFFYYTSDPITVNYKNKSLHCNVIDLKCVQLLLNNQECAGTFAQCEDKKLYLVNIYDNNEGKYSYTNDSFFFFLNNFGQFLPAKPLKHPIDIVQPGKFTVEKLSNE